MGVASTLRYWSNSQRYKAYKFYEGVKGLHCHCRPAHGHNIGISFADTVRACNRRVVSDEDVALMKEGNEPDVKIHMNVKGSLPMSKQVEGGGHTNEMGPRRSFAEDKVPHNVAQYPNWASQKVSQGVQTTSSILPRLGFSAGLATAGLATTATGSGIILKDSSLLSTSLNANMLPAQPPKVATLYEKFQEIEAESKKEATAVMKKRKLGEAVPSSMAQRHIERLFDDEREEGMLSI